MTGLLIRTLTDIAWFLAVKLRIKWAAIYWFRFILWLEGYKLDLEEKEEDR